MLSNILIILIVIAVYACFKNPFLAFILCIALLMVRRSLAPFARLLWERRFPPPTYSEFYQRGLEKGENLDKGARILLITRQTAIRSDEKAHREQVSRLLFQASEYWREKSEAFRWKSQAVEEHLLPVQICTVNSGEKDRNVKKCFRRWQRLPALASYQYWKENQDLFLYDGMFQDEDCLAVILFERGI